MCEGAEVSLGHGAHGALSEDGAALGGQMGLPGGEESGMPSRSSHLTSQEALTSIPMNPKGLHAKG